jgi:hypothetical protein
VFIIAFLNELNEFEAIWMKPAASDEIEALETPEEAGEGTAVARASVRYEWL